MIHETFFSESFKSDSDQEEEMLKIFSPFPQKLDLEKEDSLDDLIYVTKNYDAVTKTSDLYRLDGLNNDFDLEEYIESDGVCAIEWPHQIDEIIPNEYLNIKLSRINDDERIIEVEGIGRYKKYEELI